MLSKGSCTPGYSLSYRKPEVINRDDVSSCAQRSCKHSSKELRCQSWQNFLWHEWKWHRGSCWHSRGSPNSEGAVCAAWSNKHHSYRTWPLQAPSVVSFQNSRYFDGIQEIQDWLSARVWSINKPWSHLPTVFTGDSSMYEWLLYLGMTRWALLIA